MALEWLNFKKKTLDRYLGNEDLCALLREIDVWTLSIHHPQISFPRMEETKDMKNKDVERLLATKIEYEELKNGIPWIPRAFKVLGINGFRSFVKRKAYLICEREVDFQEVLTFADMCTSRSGQEILQEHEIRNFKDFHKSRNRLRMEELLSQTPMHDARPLLFSPEKYFSCLKMDKSSIKKFVLAVNEERILYGL